MVETFTADDFSKYVNDEFVMTVEETEGVVPLKLIQVDILGEPVKHEGWGKLKMVADRAPFALVFKGSRDVLYPQFVRTVTHVAMGKMELFLVPIDEDEEGYYYESIFN